MIAVFQLALAASPSKRLSDVYGGTAGVPDETKNVAYRQLIISTGGAVASIGSASGVTASTGVALATTGPALILGPFPTGAVKLSDLYAIGAGATLTILGVPY